MTEEPKIRIGDARPLTTPDYLKMLSEQSEAGNALVLAGLVEDWLQKLLMHSTRSLSNTLATKIYDGYGPLSQFSQKIEIAYIFELIDENVYDELRAIKEIRNRFAHTTVFRNFKSEEVAKECQRLKGWKKNGDNQMLYLERTKACVEAISKKISLKILVGALKDAPGVDDRTLPDR